MPAGSEYQVIDDMTPSRHVTRNERDALKVAERKLARADRGGPRTYALQSSTSPGEQQEAGTRELLDLVRKRLQQNPHRPGTHHIRSTEGRPVRITITRIPEPRR